MPIYEYECENGHKEEVFYKSFKDAESSSAPACSICSSRTDRIASLPLQPHLYGDPEGYHKPSPTKRHSTKTVDKKDGNKYSMG